MPASPLVFDSWALLALVGGEAPGRRVKNLQASKTGRPCWITTVNMGEVWYQIAKRRTEADADAKVAEFLEAGLALVEADWTLTRRAAQLKYKHKLIYADSFAAALALQRDGELVIGDPDCKKLGRSLTVRWL